METIVSLAQQSRRGNSFMQVILSSRKGEALDRVSFFGGFRFGVKRRNKGPGGPCRRAQAMPGFGLDQMWMSVRHQALPLKPRLVIVAFIDEDLDRSLTAYRQWEGFNKPTFELEGGILRPQNAHDRPTGLIRYLERILRSGISAKSSSSRGRTAFHWEIGG